MNIYTNTTISQITMSKFILATRKARNMTLLFIVRRMPLIHVTVWLPYKKAVHELQQRSCADLSFNKRSKDSSWPCESWWSVVCRWQPAQSTWLLTPLLRAGGEPHDTPWLFTSVWRSRTVWRRWTGSDSEWRIGERRKHQIQCSDHWHDLENCQDWVGSL